MKIIQVCTSRGDLQGGAERFCLALSLSLEKIDHDVTLITGDRNLALLNQLPYKYFTLPEARNIIIRKLGFDYFNPHAVHLFKTIVDDIDPDIIHFHSFHGLSTSLVKLVSKRYPVLVTLHDTWLAFVDGIILTPKFDLSNSYAKIPLGYLHRLLNRSLIKHATLVSPSLWMKNYFENAGFQTPLHIPNGIQRAAHKSTYQNILLWVGSLTTFKGLPSVINILAGISRKYNWKLIVIGDGPHKAELESRYSNVDFLGHCDPEPYYQKASILLITSIGFDNFPTVALEGMRSGLCVVGNNLGGIAEIIQHDHTGLLYKSTDLLPGILESLINNPSRIRSLGGNAHDYFTNYYTWESCQSRYLILYKTMLNDQKHYFNSDST